MFFLKGTSFFYIHDHRQVNDPPYFRSSPPGAALRVQADRPVTKETADSLTFSAREAERDAVSALSLSGEFHSRVLFIFSPLHFSLSRFPSPNSRGSTRVEPCARVSSRVGGRRSSHLGGGVIRRWAVRLMTRLSRY